MVAGSAATLDVDVLQTLEVAADAEAEGRLAEAEALRASVAGRDPMPGELLEKRRCLDLVISVLRDPRNILVGANVAFDLVVLAREAARQGENILPDIFRALEEQRVFDIQIAEALHAIAGGHLGKDPRTMMYLINRETGQKGMYSLSACVELVLGRIDAKDNDEWRLRYHELEDIPMEDWPAAARQYPIDDARNTLETALGQCGLLPKTAARHGRYTRTGACADCGTRDLGEPCIVRQRHRNLIDHAAQVATAFALQLGAVWGFRVDQTSVDVIEYYAVRRRADLIQPFIEAGVIRANGKENRSELKKRIAAAYGADKKCPWCEGTGKVPSPRNPKAKINCFRLDEDGETRLKTCDGTGFVLVDVPLSEKEGVSYGRDTLAESGDEFLIAYGHFNEDGKWLKDYVPYLRKARTPETGHGAQCPVYLRQKKAKCTCPGPYRDIPLTLNSSPILETGRAAYRGYVQLMPRTLGFTEHYDYEVVEVPDDYVLQPGERLVNE